MNDLWPDDLTLGKIIAPATILREQGVILGNKTSNIIIGEVQSENGYMDFAFSFILEASSLDYSYQLFTINHSVELYPVEFDLDTDLGNELQKSGVEMPLIANNEEEFVETLRKILGTKRTKQIVQAILAQSEGWFQLKQKEEAAKSNITDIPF